MPSPQKVKGKSFENAKAKFLTEIYGEKFIRVPTSGAFLGGQNNTLSQKVVPQELFGRIKKKKIEFER